MTKQDLLEALLLNRDKADLLTGEISIKEPVIEIASNLTELMERIEREGVQ